MFNNTTMKHVGSMQQCHNCQIKLQLQNKYNAFCIIANDVARLWRISYSPIEGACAINLRD